MVVRVKVRLRNPATKAEVSTVAVANAAFETDRPEVFVPLKLAERLELSLEGASMEDYEVATGLVTMHFIPRAVEVWLDVEKPVGPILADVSIADSRGEALLCDKLIDALEIELIRPGEGLWRLRGELSLRKSASPERW